MFRIQFRGQALINTQHFYERILSTKKKVFMNSCIYVISSNITVLQTTSPAKCLIKKPSSIGLSRGFDKIMFENYVRYRMRYEH